MLLILARRVRMQNKIALLMEETGCERGEAELALQMCSYVVEDAVRSIGRLHKNIVVVKGRFILTDSSQFGLVLLVINIKTRSLLRSRAVLSYNPAVCGVGLDKEWFEFEKFLYGCRLWEGSLPPESLEIERRLTALFAQGDDEIFERAAVQEPAEPLAEDISRTLKAALRATSLNLRIKKDILDLGQFQALRNDPEAALRMPTQVVHMPTADAQMLVLAVSFEEDANGKPAAQLQAGDIVAARIEDPRDIAQYLARLFGGRSKGSAGIAVPVEAIETGVEEIVVRIRFSAGICGDGTLKQSARVKVAQSLAAAGVSSAWWMRFFNSRRR